MALLDPNAPYGSALFDRISRRQGSAIMSASYDPFLLPKTNPQSYMPKPPGAYTGSQLIGRIEEGMIVRTSYEVRVHSSSADYLEGQVGYVGTCPISGYRFSYAMDKQKQDVKWDIHGKPIEQWDVESLDGDGG